MDNIKNKRVYTITFHRANNYGAVLQAYALQKFLDKRFDSRIIDYDNLYISNYDRLILSSTKNIFKIVKHIIPRIYKINWFIKRENSFNKYRKKLKLTNYYNNVKDLQKNFEDCEVLITGSDQVWNPGITVGYDDAYFLNFGNKDIRRISYAASCGDVNKIDINELKKHLKIFDFISVREKKLYKLISGTNIKPFLVCDPTLLMNKREWENEIDKERIVKEKYLFCYSVGNGNQNFYDTINRLSRKYGYLVIYFDRSANKIKGRKKSYYSVGPNDFLNLLYYSEFCITTSFHGVALSSVLNKKVFVILSSYSERITTLLDILKLNDLIVTSNESIDRIDKMKINWDEVNDKIQHYSKKSADWLINAIDGDNNE